MSYVDDNLLKNEKVLFRARVSKAVFMPAILSSIIALVYFFLSANFRSGNGSSGTNIFMFFIGFIFVLLTFYTGLKGLIYIGTTEFAVTNRRVIAKTGFIRRHTVEMLLMKVESVSVNQGILGRIMGFGTVFITGTGGTTENFRTIAAPLEVRKRVNEILEGYMSAYAAYQEKKIDQQNS